MTYLRAAVLSLLSLYGFGSRSHARRRPAPINIGHGRQGRFI